jgi:LacI family transcriptional regulator
VSLRKIAFLSPLSAAFVHRLLRGSLSYAETAPKMVIRSFRLERGFHLSAAADQALRRICEWQPDGFLTVLESAELAALLARFPAPQRVASMCAVGLRPGVAVVTGSFAAEAETAVRHFRQQGLRSLFLLSLESAAGMQNTLGDDFARIVRASGGGSVSHVEVVNPRLLDDPEAAVAPVPERLAAWLRGLPKPCGVFCPQLGGGGYVIRACQALDLRVPDDISIIGADDADISLASVPTLTSVTPVGEIIGFEAARTLDGMLAGKFPPGGIVRLDAMDLVVRESTGAQVAPICDIAGAIRHIERNFHTGLSVAALHRVTQQVSGKTFHTHFKLATGRTPGEAIRARQLQEARRLLSQTRLPVTLIAEKCGFASSSDFARRFRATTGVSPSEYRSAWRTPDDPAA